MQCVGGAAQARAGPQPSRRAAGPHIQDVTMALQDYLLALPCAAVLNAAAAADQTELHALAVTALFKEFKQLEVKCCPELQEDLCRGSEKAAKATVQVLEAKRRAPSAFNSAYDKQVSRVRIMSNACPPSDRLRGSEGAAPPARGPLHLVKHAGLQPPGPASAPRCLPSPLVVAAACEPCPTRSVVAAFSSGPRCPGARGARVPRRRQADGHRGRSRRRPACERDGVTRLARLAFAASRACPLCVLRRSNHSAAGQPIREAVC
jgi:hypothetical protein